MVSTSKPNNEKALKLGLFASLLALSVVSTSAALAGADTTFSAWVTQMTGWIEGSLGLGISIAFVIIGIVYGAAKQNLMAFAIGVGAALGLNYTPAILTSMFTATIF
jgi:conjugal transfer pilus assembly protein TraA